MHVFLVYYIASVSKGHSKKGWTRGRFSTWRLFFKILETRGSGFKLGVYIKLRSQ